MRGSLELTSRPGKTVFRLVLPLAPSTTPGGQQQPEREHAPA
jgi:hypothetical protein